ASEGAARRARHLQHVDHRPPRARPARARDGADREGRLEVPVRRMMESLMIPTLQSFIGGRWIGQQGAQVLLSAVNGRPVAGTHILVPRGGVAVHINAFNFPVWGLLEKFAPSFLAGMPCIAKPATATSYLTEAAVRLMHSSGLLPDGSLQLVIGSTGDLLDCLDGSDVVTFTGSADTAAKLRVHPNIVR